MVGRVKLHLCSIKGVGHNVCRKPLEDGSVSDWDRNEAESSSYVVESKHFVRFNPL